MALLIFNKDAKAIQWRKNSLSTNAAGLLGQSYAKHKIIWTLYLINFVVESEIAQSCPTLCDPMDCSLPGFSVHGIFLARVLEWVAISFSRGSSWLRDQTQVSCIAGRSFTVWSKPIMGDQVNPWQQRQTFNSICHLTTLNCWNCNHA